VRSGGLPERAPQRCDAGREVLASASEEWDDGHVTSSRRPTQTPGEFEEYAVIDHSVAHPARVYEWLLGGKNNFEVDRETAQRMGTALPGGVDAVKRLARNNRGFLVRSVDHLARKAGLRQFLDLGSGIPTSNKDNVHDIAQAAAPSSRIVYVDYDPVVLAMAHQLLRSHADGDTDFVLADIRDADMVVDKASETLDFSQPVAFLVVGLFHTMTDDPRPIVEQYVSRLPSGSYMAMSNIAADIDGEHTMAMAARYSELAAEPMVPVPLEVMESLFEGFEMVEPGIVPAVDWHNPDRDPEVRTPPMWAGVGRLP
jgi:S-adenosyl methyltransferase